MFETKNLIIKKGCMEDAYDMHVNIWSQEESAKYMLWRVSENLDQSKSRIVKWLDRQKDNDDWFVYDKNTNKAIGFCGINKLDENKFGDIGVGVGKKFTNKGYGSQILTMLIEYAKSLGAKEIEYSCMSENIASKKLAEKFGFKYFKTGKIVRKWDNKEFDLDYYILEIKE